MTPESSWKPAWRKMILYHEGFGYRIRERCLASVEALTDVICTCKWVIHFVFLINLVSRCLRSWKYHPFWHSLVFRSQGKEFDLSTRGRNNKKELIVVYRDKAAQGNDTKKLVRTIEKIQDAGDKFAIISAVQTNPSNEPLRVRVGVLGGSLNNVLKFSTNCPSRLQFYML